MIGTIRRHTKWLWWFIIAATIFSFVAYFSPNQRNGAGLGSRRSSAPDLGAINGEPITPDQLVIAEREARLFFFLRTHTWPESEDQNKQILQLARQNLVLQSLLNEYKITATTEAAARYLKQMFGLPEGQAMPQDKLVQWVQTELTAKGGLTMFDLDNFARHQTAQEQLMALFGMSGKLVTPKEEEFFYRRENEPMATEIISFATTNYYPATAPTEAELQDYFIKHEAEYRLPDRVVINYIVFEPSNYTAKADVLLGTNVDDKIDELYHQQGPEAFKDESGQVMTNTEAKAKIKRQMRLYAEMGEARKDANAFLSALSEGHDETHPYAPSDLEKLAKAKGLVVKTTAPFDEMSGSKDLDLPAKALHFLFALRDYAPGDPETTNDPERTLFYAPSPLIGDTAVYVAGLAKRMPSQLQPLPVVLEQVKKDYREAKAIALTKEAGDNCAEALGVGLMQGKSFNAVCAAQNVKPETLPPFALTDTNVPAGFDRASFQQLVEAVFPLPAGQSSKFIPTTDGGVVAYLKARLPVDEARMAQELPMYLARRREQLQVAAFTEWLNHQMQQRLTVPPPQKNGAG